MKIAIGSDHAGFELKNYLKTCLEKGGHTIVDCGTHSTAPADYPDFAAAVCTQVIEKRVERGIVVCGSGVGAAIAANKFPGIRASVCHDAYSAAQGVEHDDMNVLILGARIIGLSLAEVLVERFLQARFSNEDRHNRRLQKVIAIEKKYSRT